MGEYLNSALICGSEWNRQDIPGVVQKLRHLSEQTQGRVMIIGKGQCENEVARQMVKSGAHEIIQVAEQQGFIEACEKLIEERQIGLITFVDSYGGKELASTLATKMGGGLTADCIDLEYQGDSRFIFSRAALNDSVIVKVICTNTIYQMCTVKKNAFVTQDGKAYQDGVVTQYVDPELVKEGKTNVVYKVLERISYDKQMNNHIDCADLVFGFGRGIHSEETLNRLKLLAKVCSAEIGGTRASVEAGLLEEERQIGQSGISISPKVYVAFGISGASQHMVGLKNAKMLISINHNKDAPIAEYSDYVVNGDVSEVIEELLLLLEEKNQTGE